MNRKSQLGFTLVELVIVIVLLGLLAATALPRFLNVSAQAQSATIQGMQGGFATGVALARAQFFADGNSSNPAVGGVAGTAVVLDSQTIFVSQTGWPTRTSSPAGSDAGFQNQTAEECLEVWNFILQAPPVATTGTIANNTDFFVSVQTNVNANNTDLCQFSLIVNGAADADRFFTYSPETGQVLVSPTLP